MAGKDPRVPPSLSQRRRPQLAEAHRKGEACPITVAKLDRQPRDVREVGGADG